MIEKESYWHHRLWRLLYAQFRQRKRIKAFAQVIMGRQIQELEDVFQAILTARVLDEASGYGLDLWGKVFGERRGGREDEEFLAAIQLAAAIDRNNGTPEEVIAILSGFLGTSRAYVYEGKRWAGFWFQGLDISDGAARALPAFAKALAPLGVRIDLLAAQPASYFGFDGDPSSGGFGTVEDPAVGGEWTKII